MIDLICHPWPPPSDFDTDRAILVLKAEKWVCTDWIEVIESTSAEDDLPRRYIDLGILPEPVPPKCGKMLGPYTHLHKTADER